MRWLGQYVNSICHVTGKVRADGAVLHWIINIFTPVVPKTINCTDERPVVHIQLP